MNIWKWFWNTETKYYDGEITRDTDWGGDESTGFEPVSGGRVQEWLKNEINGKFGVIRMSRSYDENNFYSLEMFATIEDEALYDEDPDTYKDRITIVPIPISAIQGDSYTAMLTTTMPANDIVVVDDSLKVYFNYRAIRYTQGNASNEGARGTLTIQRSTDGGSTFSTVGTLPNVLNSSEPTDSTTLQEVDLGKYLSPGKQLIRVRASYKYEDIASGEERTMNSSWVTIGASVTKTELKIELETSYYSPMLAKNSETNEYRNFTVNYRVSGSVAKTMYVKVEGAVATNTITMDLAASDEGSKAISLPYNEDFGYHTHGVRQVTAWLEANDGLGNTLKTDVLVNQFMMVNPESEGYDASQKFLLLQNVKTEVTNGIQTNIANYAVYAADNSETELTLNLQDTQGNVYTEVVKKVVANSHNNLLMTVDIEPEDEGSVPDGYRTRFYVFNGTDNFILSSGLNDEGYYDIYVDNTEAIFPVLGSTFMLDPKNRDNKEENPALIYNARANDALVDSTFENFGFINDGWIIDDENHKVLRVMAGSTLTINRNVWQQFMTYPDSNMTFEIKFKVSNVTNTSDPIVSISGGGTKGIILNALKGWVRTASYNDNDNCMFAWREDITQHLVVNINNSVYPKGNECKFPSDMAAQAEGKLSLARVLLNGDPVREIPFNATSNTEWCDDDNAAIVIGNEGADIDISYIRLYEDKDTRIGMIDLLTRNYFSSLLTTAQKQGEKQRNDLLEGGRITLEKAQNLGLNCIVYHGSRPYTHSPAAQKEGWVEYFRYDQNGVFLPEFSGKNCEATNSLGWKPQGTTAKTYYEHNMQDDNSKVESTIQVALADFHESISVRVDGDLAYIIGGNLGKNYPINETEVAYPYSNGMVTVPDGWFDGNGMYRGMGYQVSEGTSLAQKKVAKINYASAMQSHLPAACKTYDELHYLCVGASPLQQQYLDKGLTRPVSAKHIEPFLMFWDEGNGNTYYTGLCTYGAGKMDKVTWGYVKKEHPMFAMVEGADNNPVLTNFLVPFDSNVKAVIEDGEMTGWSYDGATSWDYDAGLLTDDGLDADPAIRAQWARYHNFIYLNSTNIKYYDGTFDAFKLTDLATNDRNSKYWFTSGSKAYQLVRYDYISDSWVDAGLMSNGVYQVVDLRTDVRTAATYESYKSSTAYDKVNSAFINDMAMFFKANGKFLTSMRSLLFNYQYVLGFIAGTDNSAKNTYYKIDPIAQDMSAEADGNFSTWWAANFGETFDYTKCYLVFYDGDDMDSILPVNNKGNLTKPYYIERLYPYSDENPTEALYEGMKNVLYNLVEVCYTDVERSTMMNNILTNAQSLVKETDVLLGEVSNKISVWGFLHKYFFNIQYYFPQICFIEQARIRYEFAELMGHTGARGVRPISQSIGSQVENEQQFMEQRVVYMASFAVFGELGNGIGSVGISDAGESFQFQGSAMPDGSPASYTFTITPHQYIYPCAFDGTTIRPSYQRTSPKQTCSLFVADNITESITDQNLGIRGINYISNLGNFGDKSIASDLTIKGKRLTKIEGAKTGERIFLPTSISFNTKSITYVGLEALREEGVGLVDMSQLVRATFLSVYIRKGEFAFPQSSVLKKIQCGALYGMDFKIVNIPNLQSLEISYPNSFKSFHIGENVGTNVEGFTVQPIVETIYNTQKYQSNPNLQSIHVENVNWTDFDVNALSWFADREVCEFKGTIAIKEDSTVAPTVVTWDLKNKFLGKFGGGIDTGSRGLKLIYNKVVFNPQGAVIKGNFYPEAGDTFKFEVRPQSVYENTQTNIYYGVGGYTIGLSMGLTTGVLTIKDLSTTQQFTTIKSEVYVYKNGASVLNSITKTIEIWNRPAQLGDLVYYDGTFSSVSSYDGEKTPIGVCYYVAPRNADGSIDTTYNNENEKQTRFMVALEDVTASGNTTDFTSWQWGAYPINSDEAHQNQYSLFDTAEDGSRVDISSSGVTDVFDISSIENITSTGLNSNYLDVSADAASDYRDITSEATVKNDGFKLVPPYYDSTTREGGAVGDGFGYMERKADVTARTLPKDSNGNKTAWGALASNIYAAGDVVNSGYAKTLKIIAHRNALLSNAIIGADNAVLVTAGKFPPPSSTDSQTELESLAINMENIRTWFAEQFEEQYPDKWSQLYYPLASACYAYEPKRLKDGEVLADKFKAHNWFSPANGHLARICWYTKFGAIAASENRGSDIFDAAKTAGLINFKSSYHWSSAESGRAGSWIVPFTNGSTTNTSKTYSYVGRAVSAF